MDQGLKKAKDSVGGNTALSKLLSLRGKGKPITPQAVSQWKRVPVERVPDVEAVTGVPKHDLRPDFWERPAAARRSAAA